MLERSRWLAKRWRFNFHSKHSFIDWSEVCDIEGKMLMDENKICHIRAFQTFLSTNCTAPNLEDQLAHLCITV